jgi:septal ring factor EnvC (AmiA/AmiB activator)
MAFMIMIQLIEQGRSRRRIARKHHFFTEILNSIFMNQAELAAQLQALKAQSDKSRGEIVAKFETLEAAIANQGQTTPEVDAALADLKSSIQTTDDLIPDVPAEIPPTETPAPETTPAV